ncbi:MAG: hypothetical protein PHP21_04380, partial [Patescibacteria group bacterium]|nr:hypothetical protein [Patescibacteria group bacterium]
MKKFLSKIKKERKTILAIVLFCFIFILFYKVRLVFAQTAGQWAGTLAVGGLGTTLALVLGVIAYILTAVLGLVLTLLVQILIGVAQFNHIIDVPTVIDGWVMVRDLCNMFFILILLIISFATILRVENYSLKKMLPKLLIMAVLINFSKTIFGLLIDFSQVIMLTFASSFKEGGGWFMDMFRVDLWHSLSTSEALEANLKSYGITPWATSLAVIMGVIAAIITVIVIAAMLAVLVMRVIMLWIYTILSPFVFLGFAFPPLQKYTGQIWEDFTKQLVIGPALAFFIWLALTTASKSSEKMYMVGNDELCAGIGAFFCQNNLQKFIIVIGLLVGGLMVAQQMGGFIAKAANGGAKAAGWGLKTGGNWAALKLKSGAVSGLFANRRVVEEKDAEGNITKRVEWDSRGGRFGKFGAGLASTLYGLETRPTKMIEGIGRALKAKGEEDEAKGMVASSEGLKKGGMLGLVKGLGVSEDLTSSLAHGFLWAKGFQRAEDIVSSSPEKRKRLLDEIETKKKRAGFTQEEIDSETSIEAGRSTGIKRQIKEAYKAGDMVRVKALGEELKKGRLRIEDMEKNKVTKKEKAEREEEIFGLEKKLDRLQPVQTFYADRAREALISEGKKKLGDNDNEEELFAMLKNAIASDDQGTGAAILTHAASVYHLNEMIQNWRSTKDVMGEDGKIKFKKGRFLTQGAEGLNTLIDQAFIEGLGMSEQQAYALQREVSTIAKDKGHWNYTETIGLKNGMLYQRDHLTQKKRARGEFRKT